MSSWDTLTAVEIVPTVSFPCQSSPEGLRNWLIFSVSVLLLRCGPPLWLSPSLPAIRGIRKLPVVWASLTLIKFHLKERKLIFPPQIVPPNALGLPISPLVWVSEKRTPWEWLDGNQIVCFHSGGDRTGAAVFRSPGALERAMESNSQRAPSNQLSVLKMGVANVKWWIWGETRACTVVFFQH